jgi:hypothetical protein
MNAPPPPPTATPASPKAQATMAMAEQLRAMVLSNARRWRQLLLLEGVGLGVSLPLAYLGMFILIDNQFHLPVWGRLLACLGLFAGVAALAHRLYQKSRQLRLTEDHVALAIEQHTAGGIDNRLINALQLARGSAIGTAELNEAAVQENYTCLQKVRLPRPAPARPALLKLGVAVLFVLIGILFLILKPNFLSNAAGRLFFPFASIEPLYRTVLEVDPGDVEASGDVSITIRIRGEHPKTVTITPRGPGQHAIHRIPVEPGQDVVPFTFLNVQQSLTYTVSGGDYTSPPYRIDVPAQARLNLIRVHWDYPKYTGKSAVTTEHASGDFEALRGTKAQATFVFDRPLNEAVLVLEKAGSREPDRVKLEAVGPKEYRATLTFEDVVGYNLEIQHDNRPAMRIGPFELHVLSDQAPRLHLSGLEQQSEVNVEAVLPVKIEATDDYGLEKVGLFVRPVTAGDPAAGGNDQGPAWKEIHVWQAGQKPELREAFDLKILELGVSEGDRIEIGLRAVDTDPLKKGAWHLGPVHRLAIGGEGAALQQQYEQIVRGEVAFKGLVAGQKQTLDRVVEQMKKLDPANGLRLDDPKTLDALHAAIKELARGQNQLRETAGQNARDLPAQAGNLRMGLGLLADTEMVRAIRILESVPTRDEPQAKRNALGDARLTGERVVRSLQEMQEHLRKFKETWETANMLPFVQMLAERQAKLRDLAKQQAAGSGASPALVQSVQRRQTRILDMVKLIQPAFVGLGERLKPVDAQLAQAYHKAAETLAGAPLQTLLKQAADDAGAGRWAPAGQAQEQAAKLLADLHAELKKAHTDASQRALAALKEKAKSDVEAQKEIEKLKQGETENRLNMPAKLQIEDIIRMAETAGEKKKHDPAKNPDPENYLFTESMKSMLQQKDSGTRQDPNILKLANAPSGTPSFPKQSDRKGNSVTPPLQEKFDDLVGKLLEEADEMKKNFETYNLNAAFNINEPGDIGKQAGDLNSTAASAATGNMKPPTVNVGGASRTGRQGARSHGVVVGDESINRRGRDKVQEGQEKAPDQEGTLKEKKSDDPQKDTSTGTGGKKVESDDAKFSLADVGKWSDDTLKKMGKPQAKNSIVERQDGRMDPHLAELMRDMTGKQEQMIERVKTIRKELRNLYLPTEQIDDLLARMTANLEAMKEQPDAELFRMQGRLLDELRNTVQVFQSPLSGFQPSLPRERVIHGRVVDEPARSTIPGYEEAVKRYYEKLSSK